MKTIPLELKAGNISWGLKINLKHWIVLVKAI